VSLPVVPGDRELKYVVPPAKMPAVAILLAALCAPEQPHHRSVVDTVYLDTPDLRSFEEKRASDFHKTKVRLRWYDGAGPVFAEVKRRCGARRAKVRVALPLDVARLVRDARGLPLFHDLPALLASCGVPVPAILRPIVQLRYRRTRYVEPTTGIRVALDTDVAAVATAAPFATVTGRPLPWAVLELKGAAAAMPVALAALPRMGCRRAAVSKYAACLLSAEVVAA
jgi:hypothetical protein